MSKTLPAVLIAALLGAAAASAVWLSRPPAEPREDATAWVEIAALRADVHAVRTALDAVAERLAAVESGARAAPPPPQAPAEGETAAEPSAAQVPEPLAPYSEQMRSYVFGLIEEERRVKRDEAARLAEEARREREELSKGPYEQFNLKVNSLAKVLDMGPSQRDRYFEIAKACFGEFQESRKGVDWRSEEARARFQEQQDALQKQFSADVERLLVPEQREVYDKLSPWVKGPQYLGQVMPAGEGGALPQVQFFDGGSATVIQSGAIGGASVNIRVDGK
ncbi:MAG TPA: hypothetical protein DCM87_03910 [Planctomycetes bacterium]|nr:hypothetical protein [Planctomycetota bacterium]